MNVLVVEDDPIAARLLSSSLTALGYEPKLVTNADAAMAEVCTGKFRTLVCDWQLPGMSGPDFCRWIRQRDGDYIYFILISLIGAHPQARDEALAAGVDDFLTKPVDLGELKMRLHVAERILRFTAQVKQLESFLPICGYCKKIRDDRNYWAQVEDYYAKRDGTKFSHGVCPDCYQKNVVPELEKLGIVPKPPPGPGKPPRCDPN